MSRIKTLYVYHVYCTYQGAPTVVHQFDGVLESNTMIDRVSHLDVTRKTLATRMASNVGYTPDPHRVVIQSLTFLHTKKVRG